MNGLPATFFGILHSKTHFCTFCYKWAPEMEPRKSRLFGMKHRCGLPGIVKQLLQDPVSHHGLEKRDISQAGASGVAARRSRGSLARASRCPTIERLLRPLG